MNNALDSVEGILKALMAGQLDLAVATDSLKQLMDDDLGFAKIDHNRAGRRGFPEAVYCEGKPLGYVLAIAESFRRRGAKALFTRVLPEQGEALVAALPGAQDHPEARMVSWVPRPLERTGGLVAVLSAGTSDYRVAAEALVACQFAGRPTIEMADVGVAGLHRLLSRLDQLARADCVVVVAGMDGALASVVSGLVSCPVVAVPTSVGYGAAFNGVAPLLSMLLACSPGVAVVNIDNGFGAGYLAAQITRWSRP